jgi:hypothetical protein
MLRVHIQCTCFPTTPHPTEITNIIAYTRAAAYGPSTFVICIYSFSIINRFTSSQVGSRSRTVNTQGNAGDRSSAEVSDFARQRSQRRADLRQQLDDWNRAVRADVDNRLSESMLARAAASFTTTTMRSRIGTGSTETSTCIYLITLSSLQVLLPGTLVSMSRMRCPTLSHGIGHPECTTTTVVPLSIAIRKMLFSRLPTYPSLWLYDQSQV